MYITIRELVISMVTWHGALQKPLTKMLNVLQMRIEQAAWKASSFRSRAILWHTWECGIHSEFALNVSSVRKMRKGNYQPTRQWKEAADLEWQFTDRRNIENTPDGVLDFCWDGEMQRSRTLYKEPGAKHCG